MIETLHLSGRFIDQRTRNPIDGPVELIPSRFWVEEDGVFYATMAPSTVTVSGYFVVPVTACKRRTGDMGLWYTIKCPMGQWHIRPDGEDGEKINLKSLMPGIKK